MVMDRVASLLKSARELRRKIFASMPWGYRLAHLILVLANANAEGWGKLLYALFLQKGVKGMPDIRGQDANEWFEAQPDAIKKERNADKLSRKLPSGYGSGFGHKIYKFALVIAHRPDKVDDELQKLMEYLTVRGGIDHMHDGVDLSKAESYIINSVQNRSYNIQEEKKRELSRGTSLTVTDSDGNTVQVDKTDPEAAKRLDQQIELRHILSKPTTERALNKAHPDGMTFIELILEGYDVSEIVGNPKVGEPGMLPHFNDSGQAGYNFIKTYVPKIYEALMQQVAVSQ